ncbi:MAG: pyridoxamine 5'-phosphate oxidase family protein [Deltaproteobacteria bacterium]|jgi:general stress protein 26|nr:pyridoxamine 5'-phosphate oxidase family protein [Deltaproteobacteria bacterium]
MKKAEIIAKYDTHQVVLLSTLNQEGLPETRAMINIRHPEIAPHLESYFKRHERLLLITNTSSDKIRHIADDERASLYLFDPNPQSFNGLLLTGRTREVRDEATKCALWHESWKLYYPEGLEGGDFSVLEFLPDSFKFYSQFKVTKGLVE